MTTDHGQIARALRRSSVAPQGVLDIARTLESDQPFDRPAFLTAAVSEIWFTGETCRLAWVTEHENWVTNANVSEADKRRRVIRDAVNFELEQGPKFTSADWDEAKDRTLEGLLSAHIDSLVDYYYDDRPEGAALTSLIEDVTIGDAILGEGYNYLAQLNDPDTRIEHFTGNADGPATS